MLAVCSSRDSQLVLTGTQHRAAWVTSPGRGTPSTEPWRARDRTGKFACHVSDDGATDPAGGRARGAIRANLAGGCGTVWNAPRRTQQRAAHAVSAGVAAGGEVADRPGGDDELPRDGPRARGSIPRRTSRLSPAAIPADLSSSPHPVPAVCDFAVHQLGAPRRTAPGAGGGRCSRAFTGDERPATAARGDRAAP